MNPNSEIISLLEELTGKKPINLISKDISSINPFESIGTGIGYSQFNEILLIYGYNRVSHSFFQFLVDGTVDFKESSRIVSINLFKQGVQNFQRVALFYFGSIKNAFKILSRDPIKLKYYLAQTQEKDLNSYYGRHKAFLSIQKIEPDKTYYLGYIVQKELQERLKKEPENEKLKKEQEDLDNIIKIGRQNHEAYLASDHLDVYVATSMRLKHEYLYINKITDQIFNQSELKDFNLRWFDPTQAYCDDRIDKGLSEALMLKRAKCTIYLAQENDTLGKDSELATTLAQGKPVIAYVPDIDKTFIDGLISDMKQVDKSKKDEEIYFEILKIVNPHLAWEDEDMKNWLNNPEKIDPEKLYQKVELSLINHYNSRANILKERHPLGIQVNLATGVANGLLVIRNIPDCIKLIKCILSQKLDFDLQSETKQNKKYLFLREKISKCVYRTVSGDELLTNSFWNFYLEDKPDNYISKIKTKIQ